MRARAFCSVASVAASSVAAILLSFATPSFAEEPIQEAAVPPPATTAPPPQEPPSASSPSSARSSSSTGRVLKVPVGDRVVEVALGCEGRAVLKVGDRAYVACGEDGVVVVDLEGEGAPRVRSRTPTSGDAVGLFVRNGRVWVELSRIEAMPIGSARGMADSASAAASGAPPPVPYAGGDEPGSESPREPSRAGGGSLIAPKRVGGLVELGLGTKLFLTVGDLGFGLLSHAFVVRRFEAPVSLRADALPLGVATGKNGAIGAATATVLVSIDTHVFELGVGIGGGTLPRSLRYTPASDGTFVPIGGSGGTVSVPTLIRFGARDGLSIVARTSLIVQSEEFELGAVDIVGQVPVTERVALLFTGEGGNLGTASGGMAMRYRATEARGAGAVFVNGGAGYALLEGATVCRQDFQTGGGFPTCTRPQYSGPAISVGVELRL